MQQRALGAPPKPPVCVPSLLLLRQRTPAQRPSSFSSASRSWWSRGQSRSSCLPCYALSTRLQVRSRSWPTSPQRLKAHGSRGSAGPHRRQSRCSTSRRSRPWLRTAQWPRRWDAIALLVRSRESQGPSTARPAHTPRAALLAAGRWCLSRPRLHLGRRLEAWRMSSRACQPLWLRGA